MGIWFKDDRMDFYEITDEKVRKNADCVAALCMKDNLVDDKGFSTLKVKNYGKTFNLCECEPFHNQPIAAKSLVSCFLVKEDMIATAASFVNGRTVTNLRIIFGFKMLNSSTPVIKVSNDNIYKGVKVPYRDYRRGTGNWTDWALVKLDRKVVGQPIATLSKKKVFRGQPVYVIGHPVGLPLKYASGASVENVSETYFGAKLDVFSGNSGSPVFSSDTHEVIGIVVRGDTKDFRYTGKCWTSIIYPNAEIQSKGAECTRISEFIAIVDQL
ncbi:MAG: trypsin-like serine protease [Candidatus Aminicenantes bacterium]|nr:trypsin-like serine protease [Candidatus Aminicenantes bacterium]NIM82383.1 trypsin-like serine protease [Candidatus Aminicenantes bacterium]NIN21773.1 trypsin-like serine protease [Candidatus Aminicenantes bacterium]NIN42570.1 trypsin-like serine protease [Candidatus Aminicenantes bacterium]NIN85336.1 trypsin-like serine protease [Candidatus Aminicenantes bacterium]